jgi:3-oxoacyl-[acyl-carrier protein] reductase
VAAGAISTAFAAAHQSEDDAVQVPLGRFGTVADVAEAAVYLGSGESSYVTGQRVVVDGGVSVRGPFA